MSYLSAENVCLDFMFEQMKKVSVSLESPWVSFSNCMSALNQVRERLVDWAVIRRTIGGTDGARRALRNTVFD
jgi:hypothetical protein